MTQSQRGEEGCREKRIPLKIVNGVKDKNATPESREKTNIICARRFALRALRFLKGGKK